MVNKLYTIQSEQFNPYKNLALEKYLLYNVKEDECILFLWQNKNTVVIGRNQNCFKECKVAEIEKDGYLVRRLSGGGAVYHDLGNLNFTFLVQSKNYDMQKQCEVILQAVRKLGIDAARTGRNDITVEGKKFSGNAFYSFKNQCYHHGTLLINADLSKLSHYLNVSMEKLKSNGVDSVKSRVANLTEWNSNINVELLKEKIIEAFTEVYELPANSFDKTSIDRELLDKMTDEFQDKDFRYGVSIPFTYEIAKRFEWGEIQIQFNIVGAIIKEVAVYSDAMNTRLILRVAQAFENISFHAFDLIRALEEIETQNEVETTMIEEIKNLIYSKEF